MGIPRRKSTHKEMARLSEADLVLNSDGSVYHLSLHPKHISDTILTVGDPSRVNMISKFFDSIEFEMNRREFITQVGTYKGKRITLQIPQAAVDIPTSRLTSA